MFRPWENTSEGQPDDAPHCNQPREDVLAIAELRDNGVRKYGYNQRDSPAIQEPFPTGKRSPILPQMRYYTVHLRELRLAISELQDLGARMPLELPCKLSCCLVQVLVVDLFATGGPSGEREVDEDGGGDVGLVHDHHAGLGA